MYELIFLLSDPAFGSLLVLHETLKAAAEQERSSGHRPRLRVDDAMVRVRFGAFQVRLRLMPAQPTATPATPDLSAATSESSVATQAAAAPLPMVAAAPPSAPATPPRPELSRRGLRFEMRSDADPQRQHLDDVLWVVTTVAGIPGVIVVDQRVGRRF